MALIIRMPKMSDTMQKGIIASWLKKVGDTVQAGEVLAEIETDKATMELEAEETGTILYLAVEEKQALDVNNILAIIGNKGEDIESIISPLVVKANNDSVAIDDDKKYFTPQLEKNQPNPSINTLHNRILASPLAKKMAINNNINIESIIGSGDNGRIIKRDLDVVLNTHVLDKESLKANAKEAFTDIPTTSIRSIIAKRLKESKNTIPHFYLTTNIDMEKVMKIRSEINDHSSTKISFNDIIIKAASIAIRQNMGINVSWHETFIRHNNHINIGIAVSIKDGLVVPVIRFTDTKSLSAIASESKSLQEKAAKNKLTQMEMQGSTFTISNLGMYDVDSFCAIINPPEACILAIGTIKQSPVVRDSIMVVGHLMNATLSCDHRAVDGAVGATFLKNFKKLIENPHLMLV